MKYQAPALLRGLKILEVLAKSKEPLSLQELGTKLGLKPSNIFRMVYVLEEEFYIQKEKFDKYALSPKLFSLGVQALNSYSLLDLVYPILKEISKKTNQSCHFSVKTNNSMLVLAKADSPSILGFSIRPGYTRLLEKSSSGKVILAFLDSDEKEKLFDKFDLEYDEVFIKKLKSDLELVEKQGFRISASQYVEGIKDITVPILPSLKHNPPSAICIPYVNTKENTSTEEEALKILLKSSEKLSKMIF